MQKIFDSEFADLIRQENLSPEEFFRTKWQTFEEVPLYSRYNHICFLDELSFFERDLFLLDFSLDYLRKLIEFFCAKASKKEMENTSIFLVVKRWDAHPEEPIYPSFFISYDCHNLFEPSKPFVPTHTEQGKYIESLLKKLNLQNKYFVCESEKPESPELQRVNIGLKDNPDKNLITLDCFVQDKN